MLRAAGLALLLPLCVQAECGEPFDECADNTTCFQLTPYADKPYVFDCAFINATKTPTRGYPRPGCKSRRAAAPPRRRGSIRGDQSRRHRGCGVDVSEEARVAAVGTFTSCTATTGRGRKPCIAT